MEGSPINIFLGTVTVAPLDLNEPPASTSLVSSQWTLLDVKARLLAKITKRPDEE